MVTIQDVAKRANVSVSTASRILSNSTKEKYADKTRERVLRASKELGYRPNFAARALVSGKTCIVAAIFPHIYDTPFTALASLQILSGIEEYCSENGYHLLLSSPKIIDGGVDNHFQNLLAGGYLDGVIVDGNFNIDPIMAFLEPFQLPMIVLGYQHHPYYLRSDNYLGGSLLMEHLLELGHRNIGLIALPDGMSTTADQRLQGVQASYRTSGYNVNQLARINGNFSSDSGAAATEQLLAEQPNLTAIIALNDRMAMGSIRRLKKLGYRVPEKISVVGYDDLPQAHEFSPPLTTINQGLSNWGVMAMTMLMALLDGQEPDPVLIPPRLKVRRSTAAPVINMA